MVLPIVDDTPAVAPQQGRRSSYALRVSLLSACQLDCRYCRPGSVTTPSTQAAWLSPGEHARLAPLLLSRGVRKVRFTGGEPTLRKDLVDVVAAWASAGARELALTTNGLRLPSSLPALVAAGLRAVTVHLDTLQEARVAFVMGPGASVGEARQAMRAARDAGLRVKWNCVVQRGVNDDELGAMLDAAADDGVELRFIEQMNTGSAAGYVKETFVSGHDVVAGVGRLSSSTPRSLTRRHASDPAALWQVRRRNDTGARDVVFGLIASDTEPFCDACDRLRLSAEGRVRGCLYEPGGLPLGAALRGGANDAALGALLDAALDGKRSHHPLAPVLRQPFSMADVGG
ncbi:MAG: radical SAM protein [Deltaproteobacteria bacterium]|nr:radical SAM protein [Deltaproteobacteria bacterium]